MALLILAVLLAVAAVISQLAFVEMRLSRNNLEMMVATYAAESGLEQGTYLARNGGATPASLAGSQNLPLGNNAGWTRQAFSSNGGLELVGLPRNLTHAFDLYDPDNGTGGSGKRSVKIVFTNYRTTEHGTKCDGTEWIELGYVKYDPAGGTLGNFQKFRYNCPADENTIINSGLDPNSAYRFYIRFLDTPTPSVQLNRLSVTACSGLNGTGTCDMPGRINIQTVGTYRKSSRVMNMDLPRSSPVSGVFDYAIFSECQIIKDPTNPSPPC